MHTTVLELSETSDGGLYVLAEFRHLPADPTPFLIEDFTWNVVPRPTRVRRDTYGRVRIGNQWVYPSTEIDGDLRPRTDLASAERVSDIDDFKDVLLSTMVEHAERKAVEIGAGPANRSLAEADRPTRGRPSDRDVRTAKRQLEGTGIEDTSETILVRRRRRREWSG